MHEEVTTMSSFARLTRLGSIIGLLACAWPAQARVSLSDIDQKLDDIAAAVAGPTGEPFKFELAGNLESGGFVLSGPDRSYTVPAGKRLHVGEVACTTMISFASSVYSQPFALSILGVYPSASLGRSVSQPLVSTPGGAIALTFGDLNSYSKLTDTFFEAGTILTLYMNRVSGDTTGFINGYTCVLSGFLADV